LPNRPEFILAMFAAWIHGAVFVPVNWRATEPDVQRITETTGAVALVREDGLVRVDARDRTAGRTYDPDAAFITWTSGTTGHPTPIRETHSRSTGVLDLLLPP